MRCTLRRWAGLAVLVVVAAGGSANAQVPAPAAPAAGAEPAAPTDALVAALAGLDKYLSSGPNGEGWRTFLELPQLTEQVAKGPEADPAVLAKSWSRFNSGAPGLELAPFAAVRQALTVRWQELVAPSVDKLPEAAKKARYLFTPLTPKTVARDGEALTAALKKLDASLVPWGANGTAWRKYLRLDELEKQLALPSSEQDAQVLKTCEQKFYADKVGLELPAFRDVAHALRRYRETLVAANDPELEKQFAAQLDGLGEDLAAYQSTPDEKQALKVNDRLDWLAAHHQAMLLLLAVRHFDAQPNLLVQMSEPLLQIGFDRDINEPITVQDNILGTAITGSGRTVGKVGLQLIPNERQAVFEMKLSGVTRTQNVGYNGPATIWSSGTTMLEATDLVEMDAKGLHWQAPNAMASTSTQITGISAGGRIAQNVANQRVYESKPQAEQIAGQHAAARLRNRMASEINANLTKANKRFLEDFRNPLLRTGGFPDELDFSTTPDALFVRGLEANLHQLGAPGAPPGNVDGTALFVQFHQSSANNLAASILSGKTLVEKEVQAAVVRIRGSLPDELKGDENRPWSLTFADKEPLVLAVTGENEYRITIHGERYVSGEDRIGAMNVSATYKISRDGNGSKLTRQGDLEINPPGYVKGETKLSGKEVTWRRLLKRRFEKLFPEEAKSPGLQLPGKWKEAGRLPLKELVVNSGWFVLGWGMPEGGPEAAKTAEAAPAPPPAPAR